MLSPTIRVGGLAWVAESIRAAPETQGEWGVVGPMNFFGNGKRRAHFG
jgi:hypothetical protein